MVERMQGSIREREKVMRALKNQEENPDYGKQAMIKIDEMIKN